MCFVLVSECFLGFHAVTKESSKKINEKGKFDLCLWRILYDRNAPVIFHAVPEARPLAC